MPYRFQRTAPMIVSPHDPDVVYHGSHVLHRTRNQGATWQTVSPDLTENDAEFQGYSGGPDYPGHHRRGDLQHHLCDCRVAAGRGCDLDRRERRPNPHHAQRRRILEPNHARRASQGRPRQPHRSVTPSRWLSLLRDLPLSARRLEAVHLSGRRLRWNAGLCSPTAPTAFQPTRRCEWCARTPMSRACCTRGPSSVSTCPSMVARTGFRSSRTSR